MGRLTTAHAAVLRTIRRRLEVTAVADPRCSVAASKRKGLWMGGRVPLGYEKDERTLRINEAEARNGPDALSLYRKHVNAPAGEGRGDRLRLRTKQRFGRGWKRGRDGLPPSRTPPLPADQSVSTPAASGPERVSTRASIHRSLLRSSGTRSKRSCRQGLPNQGDARRRAVQLPWCINTGKSLIPLTLRFLPQKRNLLIPLEFSQSYAPRQLDAMFSQNIGDGARGYRMAEIREGPRMRVYPPPRIRLRHPYDKLAVRSPSHDPGAVRAVSAAAVDFRAISLGAKPAPV